MLLFSYGTLQDKAVQLANFGRELAGQQDAMLGYSKNWVEITDPQVLATSGKTHHPIVAPSTEQGTSVEGRVFQITEQELAAADAYEVSDYKRVSVALASGLTAWVYVQA
jgi:gamma-glutamylcyclotransferase (GGCT)/AIG2-like uncharacterized protein YtfP